jgi:hypothetical protein
MILLGTLRETRRVPQIASILRLLGNFGFDLTLLPFHTLQLLVILCLSLLQQLNLMIPVQITIKLLIHFPSLLSIPLIVNYLPFYLLNKSTQSFLLHFRLGIGFILDLVPWNLHVHGIRYAFINNHRFGVL